MKKNKLRSNLILIFEVLLLFYSLFYLNRRTFTKYLLHPPMKIDAEFYLLDILMLVLMACIIFMILHYRDMWKNFRQKWPRHRMLLLFSAAAIISLLWSPLPEATIYRLVVFLYTILFGFYLGTRYSISQAKLILMGFGAVILLTSAGFSLFAPSIGTQELYDGSWSGVFWHKNQLAVHAALFNLLFLEYLLTNKFKKLLPGIVALLLYFLSIAIILLSRSATGILLLAGMHGLVILALIWLKVQHRMKRIHYVLLLGSGLILGVVALLNLDLIFGLVGKSANMTGRTPMWAYLISEYFPQQPILGTGFGAFWNHPTVRFDLPAAVGWRHEIIFADNGYLDILLNQGISGLILFTGLLAATLWNFLKSSIKQKTMAGFLPLFYLIFLLVGNIPFSMFFEVETYFWMVLILFISTSSADQSIQIF